MKNKILNGIFFIIMCELAGVVGSIFSVNSIPGWYAHLAKPAFNPPGWVFGPVWTILYALMGIAMYLIYRHRQQNSSVGFALGFFSAHLVVNASWSIIFFGLHQLVWSVGVIILLWLMIAYSIYLFSKINRMAAWLLAPYLLWVSFASVLNWTVWMMNK